MIKVPVKVTYGVMAAIELAMHEGNLPIQAKVIAQRQAIPARFMEQVLQSLKQAGVVDSVRGAQGGYSLRKDPDETTLAEIVEAMNGQSDTTPTLPSNATNGHADRPIQQENIVTTIWDRVRQAEQDIRRHPVPRLTAAGSGPARNSYGMY